jgi:uncharacterized protein (TIGR03083 family)
VLSHLGSGAEVQLANLRAALSDGASPTRDDFQAIWDRWDGLAPEEMAAGFIEIDERHTEAFEALDDKELDGLRLPFAGMEMDVASAVAMRLSEHAVHSWDVAVVLDPSALVRPDAVALLADRLPQMVRWAGRAGGAAAEAPFVVAAETLEPTRGWTLSVTGEVVSLDVGTPPEPDGRLRTTTEGFLRLVYGRLDGEHTPAVTSCEGRIGLDTLRAVFPGF